MSDVISTRIIVSSVIASVIAALIIDLIRQRSET